MNLIDSLPSAFFPTRRRGLRWLKELLQRLQVRAPLSPGCLHEFVANAAQAAVTTRTSGETYAASLRRELEARARFIHLWTTSDGTLARPEWSEWIEIARRFLLPRSWKITETTVTESRRDESFKVPQRLVVNDTGEVRVGDVRAARPLTSANDLPGMQILSDIKRASDKS